VKDEELQMIVLLMLDNYAAKKAQRDNGSIAEVAEQ